MSDGIAKGWYERPKGLGTDNMSCIIIRWKEGHADGVVLDPETTPEENEESKNDELNKVKNIMKEQTDASPIFT